MRTHSNIVCGERRLEKRTVSRSVIMEEKLAKVVRFLGRAKRVWRRVRAARCTLVGGREMALMSLRWVCWTETRGWCWFSLRVAEWCFGLGLTG